MKKKTFHFRNFVPFIVFSLPGLALLKVKDDIIFVEGRCQKGLVSQNLMFLKNYL